MLPPELQHTLAPALRQLEQYRQALLADEQQARQRRRQKAKWISGVSVVCLLAAIVAGFARGFPPIFVLVAFLAVVGLIVALVQATKPAVEFFTDYEDAYSTQINNAIVKHFSPALSYNAANGISRATFEGSNLFFDIPSRYGTSDLVSGIHGNTQIQIARVFAGKSRNTSRGNYQSVYRVDTTIFDGTLLIAETTRRHHGHTHIYPAGTDITAGVDAIPPDPSSTPAALDAVRAARSAQKQAIIRRLGDPVPLNSPEFEKEFSVYASDPAEARRLLTPSLMRGILDLNHRCPTSLRLCFTGSTLIVAIDAPGTDNGSSPLDPDFDTPATDAAQLEKIHEHFAFYLGIVDDLDLNVDVKAKP